MAILDGDNFVNALSIETSFQLLGYLAYNIDIDLMIQEVVNLQDIASFDNSIRQYLFF